MDLSIIIVNWNSRDYLRKCIASILAETGGVSICHKGGASGASVPASRARQEPSPTNPETRDVAFEIIVIDSASFDGCGEMLRQEYPQVQFIQSEENLGFSKANNRAFQAAKGDVLLFLNPDTEIVGPAITTLLTALKGLPGAGAIGAKLLNSDGTLQTSCIQAFPTILNQLLNAEALRRLIPNSRLWGIKALFDSSARPSEVEMISGACLMMRRSVFEKIGRFSSDYFMYAEDVDLCYKSRQFGFTNYYVGGATIVHHGGGSTQQARSNFSNIMMIESIQLFLKKWRGGVYSGCYRLAMSGSALIRVVLLMLLSPVLLVRSGVARWRASCSKWFAVFHWGLGLSRWPKTYRRTEQATVS